MSHILVAQPTRGLLFVESQEALERELATNGQYPQVIRTSNLPLPDSRNALVDMALDMDWWKYLLLLDDDIVIPEGGLKAMLDLMERDIKVSFINYPLHYTDKNRGVTTYEYYHRDEDKIKIEPHGDIVWSGLGCVLIKRDVIEKMAKPIFKLSGYKFARLEDGKIAFEVANGQPVQDLKHSAGEDVDFFLRLRKEGIKFAQVEGMTAGHQRIERFCYRLGGGKYQTQHTIKTNNKVDYPDI